MNTAEQILVIFLSTALAVLLVIAIVVGVYMARLLKKINSIADKAEHVASSAEAVSNAIRQTVTNLSVMNIIRTAVDVVRSKGARTPKNSNKDKE